MPRKQRKSKVPQAQTWQPKTTSNRAANKHKKIITQTVQAAAAQNFQAQQMNNVFHANLADVIHYLSSKSFFIGLHSNPIKFDDTFLDDLIRYSSADVKLGWDMGVLNSDSLEQRELRATVVLMYVIDCLGGKIEVPYEKIEEYYHENLHMESRLDARDVVLFTNFGKNGETRRLEGKHTPVKKLTTVDADVAVKAMLIQNGVNEKTIARVERKHFEQALLHDIVINTDEDFDDYVYIGLKKKEPTSNGEYYQHG